MRKIFGGLLVASPLMAVGVYSAHTGVFMEYLAGLGFAVASLVVISVGFWLLTPKK